MAIKLYKFGEQWGIADPSPFCVKLESYLRLAEIDFEPQAFAISDFKKSPKAKFPFIELSNGNYLGDSNLIIDQFITEGRLNPDTKLTTEQRAISAAMRAMLDESLYWVLVYSRWVDPSGWALISDMFFGKVPSFVRPLIAGKQQKGMIKTLHGQGFGRHTKEEIYDIGCKNIQALSDFLGDKKNFFDTDKPTLLDITVHANIINIIEPPIENTMKDFTLKQSNLVAFTKDFEQKVYK